MSQHSKAQSIFLAIRSSVFKPPELASGRRDIQVETFSVYELVGFLQMLGFSTSLDDNILILHIIYSI